MKVIKRNIDKNNISVVTTRLINLILGMSLQDRIDLLEYLKEREKSPNKRRYPRGIYLSHVDIFTHNGFSKGIIKNLSPEGLLISTMDNIPIGEEILLTFRLPNSNDLIQINATVVRSFSGGIGIQFKMPISEFLE
jgi:hypothetical protein